MENAQLIPTIYDVNDYSSKEFDKFLRYGFAYVKLPDVAAEDALWDLHNEAIRFFKKPSEDKNHPDVRFDPQTIVGYIDRRNESPNNRLLLEQVFFRPDKPLSIFSTCESSISLIRHIFWDIIGKPIQMAVFNRILRDVGFPCDKISALFNETIDDIFATLALLYYPATTTPENYDSGLNEHADQGFITVLWINQESLQIWIEQHKRWYDLSPKEGFVVVNIGNALSLILGERCTSAFHRVVVPKMERLSIGTFYDPSRKFQIRNIIENKLLFGGSTAEYLKDHFSKTSSYTFEKIIDKQAASF